MAKCCADAWHIIAVLGGLTVFNFFGIYFGIKSDKRDYDMYGKIIFFLSLLFLLLILSSFHMLVHLTRR